MIARMTFLFVAAPFLLVACGGDKEIVHKDQPAVNLELYPSSPDALYDLLVSASDELELVDPGGEPYSDGIGNISVIYEDATEKTVSCLPAEEAEIYTCTLNLREPEVQLPDGDYTGFVANYELDVSQIQDQPLILMDNKVMFVFAG